MASTGPRLSFLEKLDIIPGILQVVVTTLYAAITGPFRGDAGAKKFKTHVGHYAIRTMTARLSIAQFRYLFPSTAQVYAAYCKSHNITPVTISLPNGTQAHWLGSKDAQKVLVYLHGGGLCMSMADVYLIFLGRLLEQMNSGGNRLAIVFLSYVLAPDAVYPTQLEQSVEFLRYVLQERTPDDLILGGDSAGGNLVLGVLSHLSHPHPAIKPLELKSPLTGALLISPWVSFDSTKPSMERNRYKDCMYHEFLTTCSNTVLASLPRDNYNEPLNAPVDWWKGLKVNEIIITGGRDEILIDSIHEIAKKIESVHPETEIVIASGETHDHALVGPGAGDFDPTQTGEAIKAWVAARIGAT